MISSASRIPTSLWAFEKHFKYVKLDFGRGGNIPGVDKMILILAFM